jgi:hypothetical protein
MVATPLDKSSNPDALIQAAQNELESANYHHFVDLPSQMYALATRYIPKEFHLEYARYLYKQFIALI